MFWWKNYEVFFVIEILRERAREYVKQREYEKAIKCLNRTFQGKKI